MELVLQSVNYHDCPIQEREKVSFPQDNRSGILRTLIDRAGIAEAAILQTCNRTEIYLYCQKGIDWQSPVCDIIERFSPQAGRTWQKYCQQKRGMDAARHLFAVAGGLDSQMLGENQILAQVKAAYTESLECHASRFIFHRLFHTAFRAGKALRAQTDINCGAVSISLAAVEFAKENMNLWSSCAMVIGAGENAEIAARYLVKGGIGSLVIANRSRDNAEMLCKRLGAGRTIPLEQIPAALGEVDLVIASTGSPELVLACQNLNGTLKQRTRPLLIMDMAVPRDIDEHLAQFNCVTIINIDDLDNRIAANRKKRFSEIPKALKIVDDFTEQFDRWLHSLSVIPVIAQLTQKVTELARDEAKRYAKDFGIENAGKLERFAESLARKFVHGPVSFIKETPDDLTLRHLRSLDLVNQMFLLENSAERCQRTSTA